MRYVGGKHRIAKWIEEHVVPLINGHSTYIEPFVGSGAIFQRLAPRFSKAVAADAHLDLILLLQAVAEGWLPPETVSREDYVAVRGGPPSAVRGFIGFGASFGGKWFGGHYGGGGTEAWRSKATMKPFPEAARNSLIKLAPALAGADIVCRDYRRTRVGRRSLVYCDPPYAGTLGYGGTERFDSGEFWDTAARWADKATVVVSESSAPKGWKRLAQRERKAMLRVAVGEENETRVEALWVRA